jgi:predicted RNase H-like HicB family nuclease
MKITLPLHLYFTEEDDMFLAGSPQLNIMAFGKTLEEAEKEFSRLAERVVRYYKWNGKLEEHLINLGWIEKDGYYAYTKKIIPPKGKIVSNKEVTYTFTLPTGAKESMVAAG